MTSIPGNGFVARLDRAVEDIRELKREKADRDDVERLTEEFKALRKTLQWFMGLITSSVIVGGTVIIQQLLQ